MYIRGRRQRGLQSFIEAQFEEIFARFSTYVVLCEFFLFHSFSCSLQPFITLLRARGGNLAGPRLVPPYALAFTVFHSAQGRGRAGISSSAAAFSLFGIGSRCGGRCSYHNVLVISSSLFCGSSINRVPRNFCLASPLRRQHWPSHRRFSGSWCPCVPWTSPLPRSSPSLRPFHLRRYISLKARHRRTYL